MVALTGESGRGKSTLLYLLGLMLNPTSGEVFVDNRPVSRLGDAARSQLRSMHFGFVFQDASLDASRSVLDNIVETTLYRHERLRDAVPRARRLMDRFGVSVPAARRPGQISGGQAQRIALCRALLNSPPVILADEPTGNLDQASSDLVVGALRDHADGGGAVIIVTHSPTVASQCDRAITL